MTGIVDAHVHVAAPDRQRYPVKPREFAGGWWRSPSTDAAHLIDDLEEAGVACAVVVQAIGVYGYDNSCAHDAVAAHPDRFRLVAAIDLEGPDPPGALDGVCTAGARGVRLFGVPGAPVWLTDGRGREVWEAAAGRPVTLVPTVFPDALPQLGRLVASHPQVPVALDHCGFPDLSGGAPFLRAAGLFRMADLPSVRLKLTTHVLQGAARHGDPADLVDALVGAFGTDRLCWGSDHPQTAGMTYGEKLVLARHATRRLTDRQRRDVFAATAASLGWDASAAP
jgi:predicted TIM-barrel fold metal-dependent hydrolase